MSRADLGSLHGAGILEAVASQALVDLGVHLIVANVVGDQRRLMHVLAIIGRAILAEVFQGRGGGIGHQIGGATLGLEATGTVGDLGGRCHQGSRHQAGQHCSNQLFHYLFSDVFSALTAKPTVISKTCSAQTSMQRPQLVHS